MARVRYVLSTRTICAVSALVAGGHVCNVAQDVQEMEGSKFKKLCADCGLVDKKFTVTDVDLTFSKVRSREYFAALGKNTVCHMPCDAGQDKGHSENHICRV